jgi:hypothetical protein
MNDLPRQNSIRGEKRGVPSQDYDLLSNQPDRVVAGFAYSSVSNGNRGLSSYEQAWGESFTAACPDCWSHPPSASTAAPPQSA